MPEHVDWELLKQFPDLSSALQEVQRLRKELQKCHLDNLVLLSEQMGLYDEYEE